ncbi:MAG: GTP 3',8-cyclase MoaA [Bacilli bacterium]|nr:GTP 3',8-cyclase MoaA [Bacilli bacterium]
MKDSFNREVDYLRISVTDLCNLRCVYCMPSCGVCKKEHQEIISVERIKEVVLAASKLGITKVRLTGGEPLVRKGIIEICKEIKSISAIKELCLTTNGVLLKNMAQTLFDVGVDRLNVSLDTLDLKKYERITRGGNLNDVLGGIEKAKAVGFKNIKINAVLIGGFNDDEITDFVEFAKKEELTVRFIELMPIGQGKLMGKESFVSNDLIFQKVPDLIQTRDDGVAKEYSFKDSKGKIGLISPLSHSFCSSCSRIRLTSDGKIKPCLHSSMEIPTNGLGGDELVETIKKAILLKPEKHHLEIGSDSLNNMNEIGG